MEQIQVQQAEIQRFDEKTAKKVFSALKSTFPLAKNSYGEQKSANCENIQVIHPTSVIAIVAKTMEAKIALAPFVEEDLYEKVMPILDYDSMSKYGTGSKFSSDYLKAIIRILESCDETISLYVAKDYPGTLENLHFRVLIAPRVGEDK